MVRVSRGHHFLVGLSLDGPPEIHNQYRVTKGGRPTHKLVMRALTLLQKHHVDYNVLVCVNRTSAQQPLQVYDFCAMRSRIHPVYSGGRAPG